MKQLSEWRRWRLTGGDAAAVLTGFILLLFSLRLRARAACVFVALGNFVASLSCISAFSSDVFIAPGGKEEDEEEEEEGAWGRKHHAGREN